MASSHLKRLVAPKTWPIVRKTTTYITRPKPNGQRIQLTLPAVVLLREMLHLVQTAAQAKKILRTREIKINNTRVYDVDSSAGFMDVVTVDGKHYRIFLNKNNKLILFPVTNDASFTVQKIIGKTSIGKEKTQLNCASGKNIIVTKDNYKVNDSIAINNENAIVAHYALEKGATVFLVGGSHIGKTGIVQTIEGNVIAIDAGNEIIETAKSHAYVIGKEKSAITLP